MIFTRRSSGIFAPDREPIELPEQGFALRSNVVATLRRGKSGTIIKQWRFHNRIVDVLANAYMTNATSSIGIETDSLNWFAAGTGTTAPTPGDTALGTEITTGGRGATTITASGYVAGPPDYFQLTRETVFATGQANGTIGEFGWLSASTAGSLRARAIPKDNHGAATTIVKTSAATLTVDWSIYLIPLQADVVLSRTVGGTPYTITARALSCNVTTPSGFHTISRGFNWSAGTGTFGSRTASALVARTASASSGTALTIASLSTYVPGSYTRNATITTQAMAALQFLTNAGGNTSDQYASVQMGFSPSLASGQPLTVKISLVPS